MLPLPQFGAELDAEFIVDTSVGFPERRLANGQYLKCRTYEITLDRNDEPRQTEVLVLEGDPRLGTAIRRGHLLQMEMMDGGDVSIEAL